jgi:hypothetical protein
VKKFLGVATSSSKDKPSRGGGGGGGDGSRIITRKMSVVAEDGAAAGGSTPPDTGRPVEKTQQIESFARVRPPRLPPLNPFLNQISLSISPSLPSRDVDRSAHSRSPVSCVCLCRWVRLV